MMNFTILRVEPKELPKDVVICMGLEKITLDEFSVYVWLKDKTIYVNKSVPEEDVKQFVEVVNFPHDWLNDDEIGKGKFLDYAYKKYGCATYLMLVKAHFERRRCERKNLALKKIKELENVLEKTSGEAQADESLLYAAYSVGRKTGKRTDENFIDCGIKYVFALGYLLGNKTLQENLVGGAV